MDSQLRAKHEQPVGDMFNAISGSYDRLNRILSFGIDQVWRKRMIKFLPQKNGQDLLDIATGTGDQIMHVFRQTERVGKAVGIDLAEKMLEIAQAKIKNKSYKDKVSFQVGSAVDLPFPNESFDSLTISFGVRNFSNLEKALQECHRVLRPGGRLLILEFSMPTHAFVRVFYLFYLRHILPRVGKIVSKNSSAYTYLQKTIEEFPSGNSFCSLLTRAGFLKSRANPFTFGVATLYQGEKVLK